MSFRDVTFSASQIDEHAGSLKADHLAVLRLSLERKTTYSKMAETLGVENGTIKSRLNRARNVLLAAIAAKRAGAPHD